MTVALSHKSALRTLLLDRAVADAPRYCFPGHAGETPAGLEIYRPKGAPLEVLVTAKDQRAKQPRGSRIHLAQNLADLPAFVKVDGIYVASPELVFVQMASSMSFTEALLFAYYLCGDYRPSEVRFATGNQALTSVDKLTAFLDALPPTWGKKRAQSVLRYVIDGSNSPQESRLAIVIVLPPRRGGFGLMHPTLNTPVPGTTKTGDLCWLDHKLILEYDSNENHQSVQSLNADSIRRAKIELAGYHVISVTSQQLRSLEYLNDLGKLVASNLNAPLRIRSAQFSQAQRKLHHELFSRNDLKF